MEQYRERKLHNSFPCKHLPRLLLQNTTLMGPYYYKDLAENRTPVKSFPTPSPLSDRPGARRLHGTAEPKILRQQPRGSSERGLVALSLAHTDPSLAAHGTNRSHCPTNQCKESLYPNSTRRIPKSAPRFLFFLDYTDI